MRLSANPTESGDHQAGGLGAVPMKVISKAIGAELRRTREKAGLTREQLVKQLPSGVGDRTVLSYEHGVRLISVLRLIEICWVLGADAAAILTRGLQRARIHMENMALHLDLRELHRECLRSDTFRPMAQWARNALNEHPSGVMAIEPVAVENLALFIGCSYLDLANYLGRFTPHDNNADDGHWITAANSEGISGH
jgi:transcriptional regulator with XRE-family HTH domain